MRHAPTGRTRTRTSHRAPTVDDLAAYRRDLRLGPPGDQPDRWLASFETLDIEPDVVPLFLKQNAITGA